LNFKLAVRVVEKTPEKKFDLGEYDKLLKSCIDEAPPAPPNPGAVETQAAVDEIFFVPPQVQEPSPIRTFFVRSALLLVVLEIITLGAFLVIRASLPRPVNSEHAEQELRHKFVDDYSLMSQAEALLAAGAKASDLESEDFKKVVQAFNQELTPDEETPEEYRGEEFIPEDFQFRNGALEYLEKR
jgi:hypothetical protein